MKPKFKKNETVTLDYLLEGCQIISFDYRYLYVNDVVAKQGKLAKEELHGHTMMEKYPGIEETVMFAKLKECMEKRIVQNIENEFIFPDGSRGWFELRMEPLPEGAFILSLDITERKMAEIRAKELEELKNKFIKIVSHQFRTPLSSIRWSLEQFLSGEMGHLQEGQEVNLRMVYKATVEIISRTGDLLAAMDIEEGKFKPEKSEVQLDSLLNSVLDELKPDFEIKKIISQIKYPAKPLPSILIDPQHIREVFYKLIGNAITYTRETGSINISLVEQDNKIIRFEITDTGIGIPSGEQKQVFQRFYRASNSFTMKPDGSGLGLYLAKYYIELHNGQIGFVSRQENNGSTFWFELPII